MLNTGRGRICPKRNTRRHLHKSYKSTILVKKDRQGRLLLAIYTNRRQHIRPTMRQVPTIRQLAPLTTRRADTNDDALAFRVMGAGHHGTTPNWKTSTQIPSSRNRLLHQMGGSRTTSDDNWEECLEFVWKTVICRFGIPRVLVSDNGKQFHNLRFRQFSQELGIHNHYSSPGHPQANGQVEVTNQSLLKLIKTQLEGAKGLWPEELQSILWAYRTTVRIPTGETPFRMTYGSEAVVPVEIGLTTFRASTYDDE